MVQQQYVHLNNQYYHQTIQCVNNMLYRILLQEITILKHAMLLISLKYIILSSFNHIVSPIKINQFFHNLHMHLV